ncbi:hypothetical protein Tco_0715953 [Tanacetum coccineum]
MQSKFINLSADESWNHIKEYVRYQDDAWEEPSPVMNIYSILKIIKPTFKGRLKAVHKKLAYLITPPGGKKLKNPYRIYDLCGGAHEANEYDEAVKREHLCLSRGDIFDDPSLQKYYQNDVYPPWGNRKRKLEGEEGIKWVS